jgi:hypothetical protein
MGLEGHRHRFRALLSRPLHDLFEHMTMGAMDAVKVPDAYQRRAEAGRDFFEFLEDLHREQLMAPSF